MVPLYVPAVAEPGIATVIGLAGRLVLATSAKPAASAAPSKSMLYWLGLPVTPEYESSAEVSPIQTSGFPANVIVGLAKMVMEIGIDALGHPTDVFVTINSA